VRAASIRRRWQLLVLVLIVGGVLYLLAPVLTPFAVAAMFAYLFDPVVAQLQRLRLRRDFAVGVVFLGLTVLFVLMLLALIPYLQRQAALLIQALPAWIAWLQNDAIGWLNATFNLTLEMPDTQQLAAIVQEHWKEAGGAAATVVTKVSQSGFAILAWIAHLVVVPVAFFYLLRDWHVLLNHIGELLPRSVEGTVTRLAREVDETLSGFVRGQLSVMLVLGLIYAIGLRLVGLDVGPLIGIIAGLISFVPYLGAILGVAAGVIAALVQYHDWLHVVLVLAVFIVGHVLESYILVPRLVGEKIGLHPLAVIFAILAGGDLFGFLGVLLALPVASVVNVVLRYLHERYRSSALYSTGHAAVVAAPEARPAVETAAVAGSQPSPPEPAGKA
jgi:predicted PurR-regulated permease PerM